jgi:hypothetical protein
MKNINTLNTEELIEENEVLLADRKELINQIDTLQIEKENLIAVLFSMEVLLMYAELEKPPRPFNLM